MTRMEALEAVAEAAEILAHSAGVIRGRTPEDADIYTHELEHIRHLMAMLSTLDALPASPGEMVEFSAWEHEDGMIAWYRAGSRHDLIEMSGWTRLGTVRLPLVKETRDAG